MNRTYEVYVKFEKVKRCNVVSDKRSK